MNSITEDTTIYAIWKSTSKTITITYNANGGSGSMTASSATTTSTSANITLKNCTFTAPSGKQFKCWGTSTSGGTTYNAGQSYSFSANKTLYAIWETKASGTLTVSGISVSSHGSNCKVRVSIKGSVVTCMGQLSLFCNGAKPSAAYVRNTFIGWCQF